MVGINIVYFATLLWGLSEKTCLMLVPASPGFQSRVMGSPATSPKSLEARRSFPTCLPRTCAGWAANRDSSAVPSLPAFCRPSWMPPSTWKCLLLASKGRSSPGATAGGPSCSSPLSISPGNGLGCNHQEMGLLVCSFRIYFLP